VATFRRRVVAQVTVVALEEWDVETPRGKPVLHGSKTLARGGGAWVRAIVGRMIARPGAVTYKIVEETIERRREKRRPARLQSGKILDERERFLTEFTFRNRGETGVRLRLAHRVALPRSILLFDDLRGAIFVGAVIWQRGCDAGCRLEAERARSPESLLARLRNPYYAVR
jgi:hypothetical protein